MECKIFRKNMNKLLENDISSDLERKMKQHIETCTECRTIYEQELEIENMFKASLDFDDIDFKSSREAIIKNIDKNRYDKSKKKRVKFNFMKNKNKIGLIVAAAILISMFPVGYKVYYKNLEATNKAKEVVVEEKAVENTIDKSKENKKENVNTAKLDISKENEIMKNYKSLSGKFAFDNVVKFKASALKEEPKIQFGTPWKAIANTKYEYSIEGKGESAIEEGVGTLLIKGNNNFKSFEIVNNNKQKLQKSPLRVIGGTSNYIIVVIGNAHGTVAYGGDLYLIDVDREVTTLLYTKNNDKEQIVDGSLKNNKLSLKVLKFKDDSLNEYTNYNEEIAFENIAYSYTDENKQKEEGLLGQLTQKAADDDDDAFAKHFMGDYDAYHKDKLGDLKTITAIIPDKIVKLNKEFYENKFKNFINFDYKVYLMEANYKVSNGAKIKGGNHFQIVIVGRVNNESEWKIVDILNAP